MKKIIPIYEEGFWEFELPEGFEEAQEAHEEDWGFNILDGPCENPKTTLIGFVPSECWLRDVEEEEEEDEELSIQFDWILKQF